MMLRKMRAVRGDSTRTAQAKQQTIARKKQRQAKRGNG